MKDTSTSLVSAYLRFDPIANSHAEMRSRVEGLDLLSEVIVPGDGSRFVLLSECQTVGGDPRIGTVLPCDLPRIAQAAPGVGLRFTFVSLDEATDIERRARAEPAGLAKAVCPLVRDPRAMGDLLSHQLISGVTSGTPETG